MMKSTEFTTINAHGFRNLWLAACLSVGVGLALCGTSSANSPAFLSLASSSQQGAASAQAALINMTSPLTPPPPEPAGVFPVQASNAAPNDGSVTQGILNEAGLSYAAAHAQLGSKQAAQRRAQAFLRAAGVNAATARLLQMDIARGRYQALSGVVSALESIKPE